MPEEFDFEERRAGFPRPWAKAWFACVEEHLAVTQLSDVAGAGARHGGRGAGSHADFRRSWLDAYRGGVRA